MSEETLWCLVINDAREAVGDVFNIQAFLSNDIEDLTTRILASRVGPIELKNWRAADLCLWKPTNDLALDAHVIETVGTWQLNRETHEESNKRATFLSPSSIIGEEFGGKLPTRCLHVLVQLPPRHEAGPVEHANRLNKRYREEASGILERLRAKKARKQLPPLCDVPAILNRPLDQTEKIAISHEAYADLISPLYEFTDTCNEEDVSILFKKSDGDALSPLNKLHMAVVESPGATGTEGYFHGFWDRNIKDVVELILQQGESFRNSSHRTQKKLRPDFGLLVQGVCVFRGEERGPQNIEDPRAELVDKLTWVYNPAEYLLGYYCRGLNLTLVAICPPSTQRGKPTLHDLGSANLRLRRDRIANIRRLINMSTLLRPLSDVVESARGEFQPMVRDFSTVEITASCIVKTYTCEDADARVQHLTNIYESLRHRNVPNTDDIVFTRDKTLHLAPRGIRVPPKVQVDLRECIVCVLETLVVLHKIPMFHCDIQWANIIRNADNHRNWILIDWEDAAIPPTHGQPRFNLSDHSPRILEDNHGAEVDIWGVGHLITSCNVTDLSSEFKDLGRRICQEAHVLTAQNVLEHVRLLP